jgi:hypothetical protein
MGKQMEGDNKARRRKAADARSRNRSASEEGVTSGASKQRSHVRAGEDHIERLAETQRGEDKVAGPDVPTPLRGKGRSREPVQRP